MDDDLILDVIVKTQKNKLTSRITLAENFDFTLYSVRQVLLPYLNAPIVGEADNPCAETFSGIRGNIVLTTASASGIQWWTPDCPALYSLKSELISPDGKVSCSREDILAFRDISFDGRHLFLNGLKLLKSQYEKIQILTLPLEPEQVKGCNEAGGLIVVRIDQPMDEKSLLRALDGLWNSPSLITWYVSQKKALRPMEALLSRIDGTRPVIGKFSPE